MPFILKLKKGGLPLCDEIVLSKANGNQKNNQERLQRPWSIQVTNLNVVNKY